MMTEEEAKKCWCPFVGTTRYSHQSEECVARGCMAWRWAYENLPDEGEVVAYKRTPQKDMPGHFINEPMGYCGLAGKP
jgi:hypothetical protein